MMPKLCIGAARLSLFIFCAGIAANARAAPVEPVQSLAAKEQAPLLETLKGLVSIESGSGDREGLDKLSTVIAERFRLLGGQVELIEYRAYGLAVADDKQGIALIIHALAVLKAMNFREYGLVTVLINADEEVSSAGSRATLTRLGGEHDAVFSLEGSFVWSDRVSLTTAGIGAVLLDVQGKASHAGSAPEQGRNALYELAHQIMQMRDLSDPATGVKLNWTLANAGSNRNVIPATASAVADVRVLRVADYDGIEQKVRERLKNQLIPDSKVEMRFERRRPPLEMTAASQALARHAQRVYSEIGQNLVIGDVAEGGGTDAAFAALKTKAPVIERFGLRGFGAHSNNAEYVDIDSIEPRLYLLTRMIMDVARGKHE